MNEPVILAEALEKIYFGKVDTLVLRGIDMAVYEGEFVAVMGQSGSGKSTLLNLLGCLDRPTGGRLKVVGNDLGDLRDDELAHLRSAVLGFVFQFHYLLDEFTCLENALLPILIQKGRIPSEDRERVERLLRRVGLAGEFDKHPDEMSGGQNQRTSIVRALANQPRVLLADEPTGNLDAVNGAEVFRLFRDLGRETGVAIIMVTHDDRLAAQADRVLVIEDGRIRPSLRVESGSAAHRRI
ncbi:MAG: ABC transporter ATP-binding protein [Fimbriimonas sp.]